MKYLTSLLLVATIAQAQMIILPDGTWISSPDGNYVVLPDGSYGAGSNSEIGPDGDWHGTSDSIVDPKSESDFESDKRKYNYYWEQHND